MPSRRSVLAGSAAAALAATVGAPSRAQAAPGGLDRAALQGALDRIAAAGAVAALARVDSAAGTWRGAAGVVELGKPAPAVAGGRFRAGSITKTFVATVVLQLVGEGRLALTDTLERWLPGVIPNGAQVTIRDLLQHTSGIYDYTGTLLATVESVLEGRYRTFRPVDLAAIAASRPPDFEPGTSWAYSNTNYVLLGMIVRRVSGRPYATEVAHRILRPLRLAGTSLPGTDIVISGPHAHAYLPVNAEPVDFTEVNPSIAYAAGELISTTADLNRFYRALLRGQLLPPALLTEMLGNPAGEMDYGLGIYRQPLPDGSAVWGHSGYIYGYVSYAFTTPDTTTQLSVSITPWQGDFGGPLTDLVTTAFGVTAPAGVAAAGPGLRALGIPLPDRG